MGSFSKSLVTTALIGSQVKSRRFFNTCILKKTKQSQWIYEYQMEYEGLQQVIFKQGQG